MLIAARRPEKECVRICLSLKRQKSTYGTRLGVVLGDGVVDVDEDTGFLLRFSSVSAQTNLERSTDISSVDTRDSDERARRTASSTSDLDLAAREVELGTAVRACNM